jgi:hypothetical protein
VKIRTQAQLNVDGTQVPSGTEIDIDDALGRNYVEQGLATTEAKIPAAKKTAAK